eukprot:scaffold25014_cov62-Isochrysis_galbana.AAC.1
MALSRAGSSRSGDVHSARRAAPAAGAASAGRPHARARVRPALSIGAGSPGRHFLPSPNGGGAGRWRPLSRGRRFVLHPPPIKLKVGHGLS